MARKLFFFVCAVMCIVSAMTANAAPLPNGTVLKITPGVGSIDNTPCIVGSCIGWEMTTGIYSWRNISPGTDGGFIIGKSQASGGQEIDGFLTTPGQLTGAGPLFIFGSSSATLYTLPDGGTANVFDDASCTKAACIGKTALNTLNVAWNYQSIPIGSAAGCTHVNCTADQQAGIFVKNYIIDLVGNNWAMDYAQVVPTGTPSWSGLSARIIFRGGVVPVPKPNCPVVDFAFQSPNTSLIVVFGSNLAGATGVSINGVEAPVFGGLSNDILWAFIPPGVTKPWKPGTVQVCNASCCGSFPKPCVP